MGEISSTISSLTMRSGSSRTDHLLYPSDGSLQAMATSFASVSPSNLILRLACFSSSNAVSKPFSTSRFRKFRRCFHLYDRLLQFGYLATLVPTRLHRLSVHMSVLDFISDNFTFLISCSNCSRSSWLNSTTHLFPFPVPQILLLDLSAGESFTINS